MSKRQIATDMLDLALAAREAYASELFALDAVQGKIKQAALAGETHVAIRQDRAQDLQLTQAALDLDAWLVARGFRLLWVPVALPEKVKGQPTGRQLGYRQLIIDWGGADGRKGASCLLERALEGVIEAPVR